MTTNQADRHERQEPHQPTTFSDPSIQHPPGDGAKKWLPPGDEWFQARGQIVTNVDKSDKTRSNPDARVKKIIKNMVLLACLYITIARNNGCPPRLLSSKDPLLRRSSASQVLAMENMKGLLRVKVIRGRNLAVRDIRTSDPYVVVRQGRQVNI